MMIILVYFFGLVLITYLLTHSILLVVGELVLAALYVVIYRVAFVNYFKESSDYMFHVEALKKIANLKTRNDAKFDNFLKKKSLYLDEENDFSQWKKVLNYAFDDLFFECFMEEKRYTSSLMLFFEEYNSYYRLKNREIYHAVKVHAFSFIIFFIFSLLFEGMIENKMEMIVLYIYLIINLVSFIGCLHEVIVPKKKKSTLNRVEMLKLNVLLDSHTFDDALTNFNQSNVSECISTYLNDENEKEDVSVLKRLFEVESSAISYLEYVKNCNKITKNYVVSKNALFRQMPNNKLQNDNSSIFTITLIVVFILAGSYL